MRYIYLFVGMISLAFGAIGIVLPILPTTPFLLLAGFCFARSSKRVHEWFVSSKIYQKHLDSFVKERAMTFKTKACILSFASIMLLFPLLLSDHIFLKIFIIFLYVFKYYYFIFKIKTIPSPRESL